MKHIKLNNNFFNAGGIGIGDSDFIISNVEINNNIGSGIGVGSSYGILDSIYIRDNQGRAISIGSSNPTLTNILISGNQGNYKGIGIFLSYANPIMSNVTINNNISDDYFGGGGMYLNNSSPELNNVVISNNLASIGSGGGLFLGLHSFPILNNVTISGNAAQSKGGGIYIGNGQMYTGYDTTIYADKLLIVNNYSIDHGGGIFISQSDKINLQNSTIVANIVGEGDVYGAGIYSDGGIVNLVNSVIYLNRQEEDFDINYNINGLSQNEFLEYNILYSNIEGDDDWFPEGEGNISLDPEFVDIENGDFNLSPNSPCIDAGTAFFIWEGDTLVNLNPDEYYGNAPDMGAFEWYPEEPDYQPGDVTQDGSINVQDIVLLIAFILVNDTADSNEFALADLNTDGLLNVLDVVILVDMILGG